MKRALSLIIVLAMVLCLVPFGAFAEGEIWGINGNYEDGVISLNEANGRVASALYTVPEDGTLSFSFEVQTEDVEGVNIYLNSSDEAYVPGTEMEVFAGQQFDVEVSSDNNVDCEVYIWHSFAAIPGTENNPYFLTANNSTVVVPAGGEVWYNLRGGFGGIIASVSQGYGDEIDFSVVHKNTGKKYTPDPENWQDDAQFYGVGNWFGEDDIIKIFNRLDIPMYYVVNAIYPEGHMENPSIVWAGEDVFVNEVNAGSQGHYYSYTSFEDGTLTLEFGATDAEGAAAEFVYSVYNLSTYEYISYNHYDDEELVNPVTMQVGANEEVQIMVNTFGDTEAPAGNVSLQLSWETAPETPDTPAEPEVAEFNGETMGLSAALAAAAASNPTAENRAIVYLKESVEVTYNVVIDPYVTLDIGANTLTAPNVLGLSGSMINAVNGTAGGKIYVPTSANMAMSAEIHEGTVEGAMLLPVWNVDHYLFTNVKNSDEAIQYNNYDGYYVEGIDIYVRNIFCDNDVKTILNDGDGDAAENALTITIEATWDWDPIFVIQSYVMVNDYVDASIRGALYGGNMDTFELYNYTCQSQIISDTGAIFYGALLELP